MGSEFEGAPCDSPQQLAANSSPQIQQLQAVQSAAHQSPAVQRGIALQRRVNTSRLGNGPVQRQSMAPPAFDLQASEVEPGSSVPIQRNAGTFAGGGPVQRGKKEVDNLVKQEGYEKVRAALKADISAKPKFRRGYQKIVKSFTKQSSKKLSFEKKLHLAQQWNFGNNKNTKVSLPKKMAKMPKFKPLSEQELLKLKKGNAWTSPPPGLSRRDTQMLAKENFFDFLKKVKTGKQIQVYNKNKNSWDTLDIVESASNAARLVRLFWHHHQDNNDNNNNNLSNTPLFVFSRGQHLGVFEDRGMNDVVYVPLAKLSNDNNNNNNNNNEDDVDGYVRTGGIFNWTTMAERLSKAKCEKKNVKEEILHVLLQRGIPQDHNVMEAVGAMICDAKWRMTGFLSMIEELEKSKETDPTKLFSSKPNDNPVWTPSVKGGRKSILHQCQALLYDEEQSKKIFTGGSHEMDKESSLPPIKEKFNNNKKKNQIKKYLKTQKKQEAEIILPDLNDDPMDTDVNGKEEL